MRRRELRSVRTDDRVGSVSLTDDGKILFTGGARDLFQKMKDDIPAITELLDEGWSNGYLYLADEKGK